MFNLGKSIRVGMARRDMKQCEMAETLGCSKQYISKLCTNKKSVSLEKAEQLAGFFGAKFSDFIKWGEDDDSNVPCVKSDELSVE